MNRRGAFVWILVVVVIGGAVVAARLLGSDDTARTPDEPSTRVVMFGDSLTEQGNWPDLIPDREIVGAGYSGHTSEQLRPLARDVARSQPAAVFVLAGTNDVFQGQPPAWTANQLGALIDAIEDESPDTRIVLQTIPPSAAMSAEIIATNDAVRRLAAARRVELLDLHPAFDDGFGGLRAAETYDGIHFTDAGYARWVALLRPRFEQLDADQVT